MEALRVANILLACLTLFFEFRGLRYRGYRFARVVGMIGVALLIVAYFPVTFIDAGGSVLLARTGVFLMLAYLVARNIHYEFYS